MLRDGVQFFFRKGKKIVLTVFRKKQQVHESQHVRYKVCLERMELVQTCWSKSAECYQQRTVPFDFDVSPGQELTTQVAEFLHKEVRQRKLKQPDLPEQMAQDAQRWLRKIQLIFVPRQQQ